VALLAAVRPIPETIQDQNTPPIFGQKQQIFESGAVKSAASDGNSTFADAIAAIMALPLTDAEKAEAVRRLLAGKRAGK
jgi:hypothetical protein